MNLIDLVVMNLVEKFDLKNSKLLIIGNKEERDLENYRKIIGNRCLTPLK
ncbi:hypothetical protein LCGC14_0946310 [marine sediment metagenome]|uniref:Uncharacterized protein n=1 Tax=marine sediment metagenome TaxID=412755 RepID=A0A0F9NNC2_9ZZZZ